MHQDIKAEGPRAATGKHQTTERGNDGQHWKKKSPPLRKEITVGRGDKRRSSRGETLDLWVPQVPRLLSQALAVGVYHLPTAT